MSPLMESVVLWVAFAAGWAAIAADNLSRFPARPPVRFTWWGAALWAVVAVPSLLQLADPRLLDLWMRNAAMLDRGEWWRILTGNLVQDGGVAGTVSNLATLAVTLGLVGRALSGRVAVTFFALGGVASMLLQLGNPGAGNSMATLALVAATSAVVSLRGRARPVSIVGTIVLATTGVTLTLLGNEHGPAVLIGILLGGMSRLVLPGGGVRPERLDSKTAGPAAEQRSGSRRSMAVDGGVAAAYLLILLPGLVHRLLLADGPAMTKVAIALAATVGAATVLLFRRRSPVVTLAVIILLLLIVKTLLCGFPDPLGLAVSGYAVAAYAFRQRAWTALPISLAAVVIIIAGGVQVTRETIPADVLLNLNLVFFVPACALGLMARGLARSSRHSVDVVGTAR